MKRTTISHVDFAKMATALSATKEALEKELGVSNLKKMAAKRDLPTTTFRHLLEAIGINVRACLFPEGPKKTKMNPLLIQDMLTVMGRICTELKIDGSEIAKYLK